MCPKDSFLFLGGLMVAACF